MENKEQILEFLNSILESKQRKLEELIELFSKEMDRKKALQINVNLNLTMGDICNIMRKIKKLEREIKQDENIQT